MEKDINIHCEVVLVHVIYEMKTETRKEMARRPASWGEFHTYELKM